MPQLSRGEVLDRVAIGESLRGINLVRHDLSSMDLARADLSEANLRMADLSRSDLTEARLTGSFLSGAILNEANLVGSNLIESSMIGASLKAADLSRADLSGADLTGANMQAAELAGAYLVGTFLNETDLSGANLAGAYIRMAQMAGSNLAGATLDHIDLSQTDLAGVRLDGSTMRGANLSGAKLAASTLTNCDLRGADLSGADLSGCNLTGARLRDIKFAGVKLDDAWAEWVDLSADSEPYRAALEEAFIGAIGRPLAQILVEGRVADDVWAAVLAHLCHFQATRPHQSDVRVKAIHQGYRSSALYLEAEHLMSLAAYLAEFADIMGKGSVNLFEELASVVAERGGSIPSVPVDAHGDIERDSQAPNIRVEHVREWIEAFPNFGFWSGEKAVLVLTADRQIWLEAKSSDLLTLRPPHGATLGVDLIRGQFMTEEVRRAVNSR